MPKLKELDTKQQKVFQRSWRRIRRTVYGALVNQIHCHGPITKNNMPSVMKRVVGQLKDPIKEMVNSLVEEEREKHE